MIAYSTGLAVVSLSPASRHSITRQASIWMPCVFSRALSDWATDRWAASEDVEVGEVFCLGNCALGPSGMLDGALHGHLTPGRLAELTEGWGR